MTMRFEGAFCRKQRRLAKIWRAIARRHAEALGWVVDFHNAVERQRMEAALREEIINYHTRDGDGD